MDINGKETSRTTQERNFCYIMKRDFTAVWGCTIYRWCWNSELSSWNSNLKSQPPPHRKMNLLVKFKKWNAALPGVAQLAGHHPTQRKVAFLIPGWGTCGFGPWSRRVREATTGHFSPTLMFLSLSLPLSLKINKILKKEKLNVNPNPWEY